MKFKRLLALGVATLTFISGSMGACAMDLKDIFDAEYYASNNPDVVDAYGDDAEALYQHYVTFGLDEGRNGSPVLDVAAYKNAYKDLRKAYGDDWEAYVDHYFTHGIYEETRRKGVLFDPLEYAESYKDIRKTFGADIKAITNHYITNGRDEERIYGTAGKYKDISVRIAHEEEDALLRDKAWEEEMKTRPGVSAKVMENAETYYHNAADAYINYHNAGSAAEKKKYAIIYMDWMNSFNTVDYQIVSKGIRSQVEGMDEFMKEETERVLEACPDETFNLLPWYIKIK